MNDQVWAVSMFRDEEDVAEHVIKHLIDEGVDGIIVADNLSNDRTREKILSCVPYAEKHGVRLIMEIDDQLGYYQSKKMTALAKQAYGLGAEWIIPFDADEIWFSRDDRLGVFLKNLSGVNVVDVAITNHFPTLLDTDDAVPFRSMQWRQKDPQGMGKVAFKYEPGCVIHQGNHGVDIPSGIKRASLLELRHFPYRSYEHFKKKAINGKEAYEASNLPEDMGLHWRQYGQILEERGDEALRGVFETWYWFIAPIEAGLIRDPAPFRRWN